MGKVGHKAANYNNEQRSCVAIKMLKTLHELKLEALECACEKNVRVETKITRLEHARRTGLLIGPHLQFVNFPNFAKHVNEKIVGKYLVDLNVGTMKIDGIKAQMTIASLIHEKIYDPKVKLIDGMKKLNECN